MTPLSACSATHLAQCLTSSLDVSSVIVKKWLTAWPTFLKVGVLIVLPFVEVFVACLGIISAKPGPCQQKNRGGSKKVLAGTDLIPRQVFSLFDQAQVRSTLATHMGDNPVVTLVSEHSPVALKLSVELTEEFLEVFEIEPFEVHGE